MYSRRLFLLSASALAILAFTRRPARAEAANAGAFVKNLGDQVVGALKDKSMSEAQRTASFRRLFDLGFDVPEISRFVLGRFWRQATPAQRTDYQKLFEEFIVLTYAARFSGYSGETFAVLGTRPGEDGTEMVRSEIHRPDGPPVRVDWKVTHKGGQYKIVDVVVEGVSMAITQRQEFASVIQNGGNGVAGLITLLRRKVAQLKQGDGSDAD